MNAENSVRSYPPTPQIPETRTYHGVQVVDPYAWLEKYDETTKAWLDAQDAFAQDYLDSLPDRQMFEAKLSSLYKIEPLALETRVGDRIFKFSKQRDDANAKLRYLCDGTWHDALVSEAPEEAGQKVFWHSISPNGQYIAYGASQNGKEYTPLKVRDLNTGQDEFVAANCRSSHPAWLQDGSGFYYCTYPQDANGEPQRYKRMTLFHELGSDSQKDIVIFDPQDGPKDHVTFESQGEEGQYIASFNYKNSGKFPEIRVGSNDSIANYESLKLLTDTDGSKYEIKILGKQIFIKTNFGANNFRVMSVGVDDPDISHKDTWQTVMPEQDGVLEEFFVFKNKILAHCKLAGFSSLTIFDIATGGRIELDIEKMGCITAMDQSSGSNIVSAIYESYTKPQQKLEIDLQTFDIKCVEEQVVPEEDATNANSVEVSLVSAKSKDGTEIPTIILAPKTGVNENTMGHIYMYGGHGHVISDPSFDPFLNYLVARGHVVAMPHVRGGGEYGEAWHRAAVNHDKHKTFEDAIATYDLLVENLGIRDGNVTLHGNSSGGMSVLATLLQRGDLHRPFAAIQAGRCLADMLKYPEFLLGKYWLPEYGDPQNPDDFANIIERSPYHMPIEGNIFTNVMFTVSPTDDRVHYSHAAKMAARLQNEPNFKGRAILKTTRNSGHHDGDVAESVERRAAVWSFLTGES